MERVGVREIRQNLSVFLRRVRAGETFTVTDHGAPVALLTPVPRVADDPLADVIATGRVLAAERRGGALPAPVVGRPGQPTATGSLLAERDADPR